MILPVVTNSKPKSELMKSKTTLSINLEFEGHVHQQVMQILSDPERKSAEI